MWRKDSVYRVEYPEYPERAVQEVIVNALIHRDYTVIGSEVHIDIYDDRLEVYSPGGMYDGTFIQDENPYNIASTRRNPVLADVFARMDLMERRGSGLKNIIEDYKFQENYKEELKPEFRSTETKFFAVLKNLNYVGHDVGHDVGQKLHPNDRRDKILELMAKNPDISALKLSQIFNLSIRTIERDLALLTEAGNIEYVGSSMDGKWKVKDSDKYHSD